MDYKQELAKKLKKYNQDDIIITEHARKQAIFRNINIEEVKENIINLKRLVFYEEQEAEKENEFKYNCYFSYSKTQCHRYIIVTNGKCIVCTVIKINRRWQYMVEKNAKQ